MPRHGALYDEDDYDDGYYDEADYEEGYDDWEDAPVATKATAAKGTGKQANTKAAASTKAAAAAAVKKEPLAQAKVQEKYPVAPPPGFGAPPSAAVSAAQQPAASSGAGPPPGFADNANQPQPFDFSSPSPDAAVLTARSGTGGAGTSAGGTGKDAGGVKQPGKFVTLAPSKAMLAANQQLQASQQQASRGSSAAGAADAAAQALDGLGLGAAHRGLSTASTTMDGQALKQDVSTRRRIGDYVMDPALEMACAVASASPQGSDSATSRQSLHLVVLGHVDAGKSTLMGRLLHDLGLVSAKEVHRNQRDAAAAGKASFSWAWLLDERPEERARGVTIDVATTRFVTPHYNVTLLDAPGHKDFVPNMISGASQADAALLVVDGSPGGFEAGFEGSGAAGAECGQTREHAQLARSLGVEQLAVVVTKLDMAGYDKARYEAIKQQLAPFLASCGFKDSAVQWLPAVGPEGVNLVSPPPAGNGLASWWKGPCLVQAIDTFAARERLIGAREIITHKPSHIIGKPARLPVSDVFKSKAGVMVVGGKLEAGALKSGSKLVVVPGGEQVTVKSLEVDGQACPLARAGDAVEVSLQGGPSFDMSRVPQGCVLCHPDFPVPCATKFEARVLVLDVPVPLLKGKSVTLHAALARESAVITGLVSLLNSKTGEVTKAKPRCLAKGQSGVIEVTASRGVCLEEYSDMKALGRVTLREGGRTVAVGVVTRLLE